MFAHRKSNRPPVEELIIYALLVITGAIPVTNAIEDGARFGVEATIGAIMIAIGAIGIIVYAWQAARRRPGHGPEVPGPEGGGSRNR
jgi:hypothetical protein